MNPVINEKHPAMSDTDQAEHDQALRAQVRAAGALLGDVLRAQATDGVFDTVETLRRGYIDLREAEDPVAALISDGGAFVGCARNVPIFRDKVGRRIYFTTKELKDSEATRRYARC